MSTRNNEEFTKATNSKYLYIAMSANTRMKNAILLYKGSELKIMKKIALKCRKEIVKRRSQKTIDK